MTRQSVTVCNAPVHDDVEKKTYERPILEILGADTTAAGNFGISSDGTNTNTATVPGS